MLDYVHLKVRVKRGVGGGGWSEKLPHGTGRRPGNFLEIIGAGSGCVALAMDRLHTNSSTNSTRDHVRSPILMVCVVTAISISVLNITPILNTQLHS